MSIHFVSGKPGGGKSLYGVRMIMDELVHGTRQIVTNVPLKLPELNDYIQKKYPNAFSRRFASQSEFSHISDQVILLTEDDLPKFFTFRGAGVRLDSVKNAEWRQGVRPDFTKVKDSGIFYVLDEVHIAFNSRAWADTGAEVLYYLSQHRKLGDDVICITQAIGNVDKQFRSVAQDFTYLKNLSKQRAGLFRLPSVFVRSTYSQPATDNSKAMESGTFTLDVAGLASCYDTAKGVGIHGRAGADVGHRKKGLHWLYFAVGVPVLIVLFLHFGPKFLVWFMNPQNRNSAPVKHVLPVHSDSAAAYQSDEVSSDIADSDSSKNVNRKIVVQRPLGDSPDNTNSVWCTGIAILSKDDVTAFFSDGSTAFSSEGEIQKISGRWVYAFGKKYRLCGSSLRPAAASVFDGDVQAGHIVDYGQNDAYQAPPVNDAIILPSINSIASGLQPSPRVNGMGSMGSMSSSQTVNNVQN